MAVDERRNRTRREQYLYRVLFWRLPVRRTRRCDRPPPHHDERACHLLRRLARERHGPRLAHVLWATRDRGFWFGSGDRGDRAVPRRIRAAALSRHLLRRA